MKLFSCCYKEVYNKTPISVYTYIQQYKLPIYEFSLIQEEKIDTFLAICGKHFLHTSSFLYQTGRCFAERFDFLGVNHFASAKSYLIFVYYFYVCTVHLVYNFYFNQQCTIYFFFILEIFILQSLLHVSIHLYHPQGVPKSYFAKVT
jgi:hypothetical protein